ncbi:NAD(P)-dependent oxidoreductase [Endothiovibrio diazotrophicus]
MKVVIFGATGGTGRQLVVQALEGGHEVTAFVRRADGVDQRHERLSLVVGDVLDPSAVARALEGQQAVLCALGKPSVLDGTELRSRGTENIVRGMERAGVGRLVCQSALGTGDSRGLLPLHYRWLIAPLLMGRLYRDHLLQERCIRDSRLAWVIVRPGVLTDGERSGGYRHGVSPEPGLQAKVSRADAAEFMLSQLSDDRYLGKAPYLSY